MATKKKQGHGGNSRKINRDLIKCRIYRERHIREKNKVKKITKHLKRHPMDKYAIKILAGLRG